MNTVYLIISLVCFAVGLLLIALAVIPGAEPERRDAWRDAARTPSSGRRQSDGSAGETASDFGVESGDVDSDRLELFSGDLDLNLDDFDEVPGSQVKGAGRRDGDALPGDKIEFESVFFEDNSSIIDYTRETGTIDPSLKEYRKISRIGSGILRVEKDNISFQSGRKVFHYDFRKINELKTGKNFIAARIQGSTVMKLFIIQGDADQIPSVSEFYRAFLSQAG